MELKGSQTEKNLMMAFVGEAVARMKYDFFASAARKAGYEEVAQAFEEAQNNEREHGEIWYKLLGAIQEVYPNLLNAAASEHEETSNMYKNMADTARKEGFEDIASKLEMVSKIESTHEQTFLDLAKRIDQDEMFKSSSATTVWRCSKCGNLVYGTERPGVCPVCSEENSYVLKK